MHQELILRASGLFTPRTIEDFVGENCTELKRGYTYGAKLVAQQVAKAIALSQANGRLPLKFLFNGKPGIGKTDIVKYVCQMLGCNKWNTTKLNGTEVKMEKLDEIVGGLNMSNLFGDYRLFQIEEADKIPSVAQVRLLTILDDLPRGTIVACTSNGIITSDPKTSDFEPRFSSRFTQFELQPPAIGEIDALLRRLNVPAEVALPIANFACGNVRQALVDAKAWLESEPLQLAA